MKALHDKASESKIFEGAERYVMPFRLQTDSNPFIIIPAILLVVTQVHIMELEQVHLKFNKCFSP